MPFFAQKRAKVAKTRLKICHLQGVDADKGGQEPEKAIKAVSVAF